MKKVLVYLLLGVCCLGLVGCGNDNSKKDDVHDNVQGTGEKYYELEDRYIYLHDIDSIKFTYNNQTKELKDWFKKDKKFLSKFIEELEYETGVNDGGTIIYTDGGKNLFDIDDIVVIVCKKIDLGKGYNNNIHIGQNLNLENLENDVCHMPGKNK